MHHDTTDPMMTGPWAWAFLALAVVLSVMHFWTIYLKKRKRGHWDYEKATHGLEHILMGWVMVISVSPVAHIALVIMFAIMIVPSFSKLRAYAREEAQ